MVPSTYVKSALTQNNISRYEMCHIKLIAEELELNQNGVDMAVYAEAHLRACVLSVLQKLVLETFIGMKQPECTLSKAH